MQKNTWKYVVNTLLFVDFCTLAAIGLLLGLVVPKGGGRQGTNSFLGLQRHDWGDIHFTLALLFLGLLVLHVWNNWTWVVQSARRTFGERSSKALCMIAVAWIPLLLILWLAARF